MPKIMMMTYVPNYSFLKNSLVTMLIRSLVLLLTMVVGTATAEEGFVDLLPSDALESVWRTYKQDATSEAWSLVEGVLTLDGKGGDLITREKYANFDFRFEWKISPGGNSGVMYLVSEDGGAPHFSGPEYQVIDTNYHEPSTERKCPGALYDLYPCKPEAIKPAGEWNEARIVIKDRVVTHWLNGIEIVSVELGSDDWNQRVAASKFKKWERFGKNASGHIALQDHGNVVSFRNLRIKRLDTDAAE